MLNDDLMQNAPLITIAMVTLNRAWIIDKALFSIKNQTYPHEKIFVLIVDGESKDGTPELSRKILSESDFNSFEVVIQKSTIPEARNICLKKKKGELILFWDSDVIFPANAVWTLVETLQKENADLVATKVKQVMVKSIAEVDNIIPKFVELENTKKCVPVKVSGMGITLLSKRLTDNISFDNDLTILEDFDFCLRAKEKGFKLIKNQNITAVDVNIPTMGHSDIYIDMPLKDALKGIRKKARIQTYIIDFPANFKGKLQPLKDYKRYGFYLFYLPAITFSIYGILFQNIYATIFFPIYAILYIGLQSKRRGAKKGLKAFGYSLIVGIPYACWFAYYYFKFSLKKQQTLT